MRKNTTGRDSKQAKGKTTREISGALGSTNQSPMGSEWDSRPNAEAMASEIDDEYWEVAKATSQRLVTEGERFLELSRELEADAKRKLCDVLEELKSIERETLAYRDGIIADAQQQARELQEKARQRRSAGRVGNPKNTDRGSKASGRFRRGLRGD